MTIKYTKKDVINFLKKTQPIMSVAVSSGDIPRSSILIFAFDEDLNFYFVTGKASNKNKALAKNKNISFCIWENKKILIHGTGKATLLKLRKEIDLALDKLVKVAGEMKNFWPPLIHLWCQDYVIFKIKVSQLGILDLKSKKIKEINPPLTKINF